MSETKQQDLTRMLGVWQERGYPDERGRISIISAINAKQGYLGGTELMPTDMDWEANGTSGGGEAFDLIEKLGDLDHLRRGADVLMQRREYVTAAVVYQLLGDEEGVERAVRERRAEIERERQADEDKPF